MTTDKIRIGVIGAGENACKVHIPNFLAIPGVEILEVANRATASAQKVAEQFNIPTIRKSWQDLVKSTELDAVLIGTWPYLHYEATCSALEEGKHVLCEARMAMDEAEARQMLRMSYKHPECVSQLVPSPFTLRADQTILRYLDEYRIGRPLFFEFHYHQTSNCHQSGLLNWRRNKKYSGKNIMVLGIIYESLLRWFGPAKWVSSQAETFINKARDPDTGEIVNVSVPDYLTVQMQMNNGIMGSLFISEAGFHNKPPYIKVFGDKGTLLYEFKVDGNLWYGQPNESEMHLVQISKEEEGKWRVEEEFINSIRGEEEVLYTTFTTGVEYMKFTEAVNQSFNNNGDRIPITTG